MSKCLVSKLFDRIFFTLLNSCWCSGSHLKSLFLLRSCLNGTVAWEKYGMKNYSCCARPRKERTPVTLLGAGNFLSAFPILLMLGLIHP